MAVFGKYVTCMLLLYAWLVSLQLSDTHLCHSLFRDEEAFDNLTRQALKRSRSWPSLSVIVNIFPESPVTHHSYIFSRGAAGPSRSPVSRVHFGYSYAKYTVAGFFLAFGRRSHVSGANPLLPAAPPSRALSADDRPRGAERKEKGRLVPGFVFAHCCGNMRTGGKGLVYWALESRSAVRGCVFEIECFIFFDVHVGGRGKWGNYKQQDALKSRHSSKTIISAW